MPTELTHHPSRYVLALAALLVVLCGPAAAQGPSFSCDGVARGTIPGLICSDLGLAALDRTVAAAYAAAAAKASEEELAALEAEHQAWLSGRDTCLGSEDPRTCVEDACRIRIAELEVAAGRVSSLGTTSYLCGGPRPSRLEVTYFDTDPATVRIVRGDRVAILSHIPAASGSRYQGHALTLWEHQGEATLTVGVDGPEVRCIVEDDQGAAP